MYPSGRPDRRSAATMPTLPGAMMPKPSAGEGESRIVRPTWRPRHGSREPIASRQIGATDGPDCRRLLAREIGASC
jgi:hypothetical protein